MKKTIILASVAVAAIFAFSSCQKEDLENTSKSGVRIITAEFENTATKTTLCTEDNVTPLWSENDKIRVFGGNQYDDITLTSDQIKNNGRTITFSTTLTGTLYAVYPASATTMESCSDGKITFTIPAVQDGTFASANICVAKSSTTDGTNKDKLVFSNATSVLEFSQTAATTQVLSVRVEAANAIAGSMTVNYKADGTFDTPTISDLSGKLIRVKSATAVDKYYIAVAPVTTGKIEFEYQQAVKVATVTTEAGKTLAANKIYECSMDGKDFVCKTGTINGHDYVQVGSVKWATMNIGATILTGYGDLLSWGDIDKKNNYGESYYVDPAKSINTNIDPDSGYDVARVKWGSTWRMPTTKEFSELAKECFVEWTDNYDGTGVKGVIVWKAKTNDAGWFKPSTAGKGRQIKDDGSYKDPENHTFSNEYNINIDSYMFFPAAGRSGSSTRAFDGSTGNYRSSTWISSNRVYCLSFNKNEVNPQTSDTRFGGFSVRPVSD